VDQHRVLAPQGRQRPRQLAGDLGMTDADQLVPGGSGIRQRAEDVEDRPQPDLPPGRTDEAHCGVERRRVHEADACFFDAASNRGWSEVDRDAESFEEVGRPALRRDGAVAVLGHPDPRRRR
jgi:hypothetical protein